MQKIIKNTFKMELKLKQKPPKWWSKIDVKIDAKRDPLKEGRRDMRKPISNTYRPTLCTCTVY
jgi:hypothetical protein